MQQAVRDALIGFMAALSQAAQAEANKEAQRVGIAHVKATPNPTKPRSYLGRKPSYSEGQITEVITLTGEGKGVSDVAKQLGLSRAAVYRINKTPVTHSPASGLGPECWPRRANCRNKCVFHFEKNAFIK